MSDMNSNGPLGQVADGESGTRTFTMHVDFLAKDEKQALYQAELYVEALGILRTEVDSHQTRVSEQGDWSAAVPVFCCEPGPDPMDVCLMLNGHPGSHSGAGLTESWTDEDLPRAPDTIEDW